MDRIWDSDDGGNGVNIEDLFGENNITHLQADNIKGSLKWMKKFKQLKSLEFRPLNFRVYKIEDLESFKYLENLEELKIYSNRFDNLDFLINCKNIKETKFKLFLHLDIQIIILKWNLTENWTEY